MYVRRHRYYSRGPIIDEARSPPSVIKSGSGYISAKRMGAS